jgi:aryl-alcohol dehydrogenase-like predicted oxidoreductase
MQNHCNLVYREEEREMISLCLDQGAGCIPDSPLARGLLAGKRERSGARRTLRAWSDPLGGQLYRDDDFDVVDVGRAVAAERASPRLRSRWPGCSAKPGWWRRSSARPRATPGRGGHGARRQAQRR